MSNTADIGAFLAAAAGLTFIMLIIFAALWTLKSIGLSQMAKNKGIENSWLAWLPVGDLFIMGTIVEEMNFFGIKINNLGLWFPVVCLMGGLLGGIPILGILLFIGVLVFQIAFIHKFFSLYTLQATLYTVLSVFFAFLYPIFIFSLRHNPVFVQEIKSPASESVVQDDPVRLDSSNPVPLEADLNQEKAADEGDVMSRSAADDPNPEKI